MKRGTQIKLFPENRKGQFFLIAALIIVIAIVSIVTVTNYVEKQEIAKLYDLGEELGIESQHVLDYGTYSELKENEMKELMEEFIQNYVDYLEEEEINLYFVFGNRDKVNVIGYQDVEEKVEVYFDGTEECNILETGGETQTFDEPGDVELVIIQIGETEYQFELKEGENFYFIIWQEIGGEKIVVTNE